MSLIRAAWNANCPGSWLPGQSYDRDERRQSPEPGRCQRPQTTAFRRRYSTTFQKLRLRDSSSGTSAPRMTFLNISVSAWAVSASWSAYCS